MRAAAFCISAEHVPSRPYNLLKSNNATNTKYAGKKIYIIIGLCYTSYSVMIKEKRQAIFEGFRLHEKDSGSPEVQVALLTERINNLTEHMRVNRHDYHSLRGLLMLVGQRQRLLKYVNREDPERYRSLIARLGLRK